MDRVGALGLVDRGLVRAPLELVPPVLDAVGPGQQELAAVILKDPAVESLSSFIGIDGTNTTLNSGRILINLKPLEERHISASDVIRFAFEMRTILRITTHHSAMTSVGPM